MHNNKKIIEVDNPITLVKAENSSRGKSIRVDSFRDLSSKINSYAGVKVALTRSF